MNDARNLLNLLTLPTMAPLLEKSDERLINQLKDLIRARDFVGVHKWMRTHPSLDYGEWQRQDLLALATKYRVPNRHTISRAALIRGIRQHEESRKTESDADLGKIHQPDAGSTGSG